LESGRDPYFLQTKMKSSSEALPEEFSKNNMIERLLNSQEDISGRNVLF